MRKKYQAIVGCAFLHKKGKLLIAKRSNSCRFLPGKFELIGGHIEFGETIEEGLKREAKEEIGINIKLEDPFYAFTYVSDGGNRHSVEICYFAKMVNPSQPVKLNPEEHSEYKWINKNEINIYFPLDDPERLAAKKGFTILERDIDE